MTLVRLGMLIATVAAIAGCEPYRIEYHTRPSYYQKAAVGELPDRVELADGTIVVYTDVDKKSTLERRVEEADDEGGKIFQPREELDDGTVILRALLPEHVITNTMGCLRYEEYDLLWEQMLSERTKSTYQWQGMGVEEFADFCREHRRELMTTLNRMSYGFLGQDVFISPIGGGVMRAQFGPRIQSQFEFKYVDIVNEYGGLKLLLIH